MISSPLKRAEQKQGVLCKSLNKASSQKVPQWNIDPFLFDLNDVKIVRKKTRKLITDFLFIFVIVFLTCCWEDSVRGERAWWNEAILRGGDKIP